MEEKRLVRYLNSVGKKCFVKYYEMFSDSNLSNQEIVDIIETENSYTRKACNSRTSHARMILREGGAKDALELIASSDRLSSEVITQAKNFIIRMT
jgi:protease II